MAKPYQIPNGKGKYAVKLEVAGRVKVIGTIENGVYKKSIQWNEHMMHKLDSIGFNKYMIDHFPNFNSVEVTVGKEILTTSKDTIQQNGVTGQYNQYEEQYFLPIEYFSN